MMPSGKRKKQRSQKVPGSARIQKTWRLSFQLSTIEPPLPGLHASGGLDPRPGLVANLDRILADIDARLAFGDHFLGREDRRIVLIVLVHQGARGGVGGGVLDGL